MKKRTGILFAMIILMGIPFAVKASEASGSDEKAVKSYGTIIYEDKDGSVKIYAEDISLLQEKLASIPDEIFDPILYGHTHIWEYIDVTDQGHTKHCDICGSKYDITNAHNEATKTACTITFKGHDYPGYEKICECGYSWVEEDDHIIVCTSKDEAYHTQSCALEGTPYCKGMEAVDISHLLTVSPTDETHHQRNCFECGYQGDIEECVFDIEEDEEILALFSEDSEETNPIPKEPEEGRVKKYCVCGNYIIEPKTDITDPDVPVTGVADMPEREAEASTFSVSGNNLEGELTKKVEAPTSSVSENDSGNKKQDGADEEMMIEEEGREHL